MCNAARALTSIMLASMMLVLGGCDNLEPTTAERDAVLQAVKSYLDSLAQAYSNLDATVMTEHATGAEVASVQDVIRTLVASGDRVDSSLLSVEIENLKVFREVNATVRTMEIWDVGRYDAFTGREKARNPASIQKAIIQLRLIDGRWMVTARRVLGQEGESRWNVTTPTPENTDSGDGP